MKYLLDTNVVSELAKKEVRSALIEKIKLYERDICLCSLTLHELKFGYARLPTSKRKTVLAEFMDDVVMTLPILDYDARAASWHAFERARLEAQGIKPPFVDGQIAAIAQVNNLIVVTSNKRDFAAFVGIQIESW